MCEMKPCSTCGEKKVASREYFNRDATRKDGLSYICKLCASSRNKEYYERNRVERLRVNKLYYQENRDAKRAHYKAYYQKNSAKILEKHRQYRNENKDKVRKMNRKYALDWYYRHPEHKYKRRTLKRKLPHRWSMSDRRRALKYFNGCCAVCERPLNDLFGDHTAAMDHWIPLSSPDCPGTIPSNMVPLCHGIGGCNTKKRDIDAEEWLISEFGKRKTRGILERIEKFFEWVKGSRNE